ncbi:hypothetical protein THMIRHAM_17980 [Thiomicrorhabdus immobilis]|uniref:Periplasmic heavy metal sensor n=1 Tax=Thiomicrorhabdus immobilis TaxID=2791037 RepID=A0ABN6CY41_9GAMM|nr:hypothetical protein [Thiomicrorhabdus immobilis]BCN94013.1 hypothetical protein THMIRHAM_17980 [Thiomicrorhabdus immobilis]
MKNFWMISLMVLCVHYSPTTLAEDYKPSSNIVSLMPIVMDNLDTLQLTEVQLDQVRAISRKSFAGVEQINAEYHVIKTELKEELLDSNNQDSQHSKQLVEELVALDKKRMMLTLECTLGLKKVLSKAQFKEVVAQLEFQGK